MRQLFILVIVTFMCCSCARRVVDVHTTDTAYIAKTQWRDRVVQRVDTFRDSVERLVYVSGDTVHDIRTRWRDRVSHVTDTVMVASTDTVYISKAATATEKKNSLLLDLAIGLALALAGGCLLAYAAVKFYRR